MNLSNEDLTRFFSHLQDYQNSLRNIANEFREHNRILRLVNNIYDESTPVMKVPAGNAEDYVRPFINAIRDIDFTVSKETINNLIYCLVLKLELGAAFNPDTSFADYEDADCQPLFTDAEAEILEKILDRAADYCANHAIDLYEISNYYVKLFLNKQ